MDALITDDPLMAARALGLRPARFFDAVVFAEGRRLDRHRRPPDAARRARPPGLPRHAHHTPARGRPRGPDGARAPEPELRVLLRAGRRPRGSRPRGHGRFKGNARVLPALEGPERICAAGSPTSALSRP